MLHLGSPKVVNFHVMINVLMKRMYVEGNHFNFREVQFSKLGPTNFKGILF